MYAIHNKTNSQLGLRSSLPALLVTLMLSAFISTSTADEKQNTTRKNPPQAQYTEEGVERCISCHAGDRMNVMAKTAHGNKENPQSPYATHGCESCHGAGSLHVSRARGGVGFPLLMAFRQEEPREQHIAACIGCHGNKLGKREGMQWTGNIHDSIGMTCVNCHQLHTKNDPMKNQKQQKEKCSQCHSAQLGAHKKLGISLDNMKCFGCHDIHKLTRKPG